MLFLVKQRNVSLYVFYVLFRLMASVCFRVYLTQRTISQKKISGTGLDACQDSSQAITFCAVLGTAFATMDID